MHTYDMHTKARLQPKPGYSPGHRTTQPPGPRSVESAARVELLPDVQASSTVRSWVREQLRDRPSAVQHDAALVVGELVANAVRHGPKAGRIRVTLHHVSDGVRIAVHDEGSGFSAPISRQRHYGLRIVDRLSTDWGFSADDRGFVVWAVIAVD